jgi:hypothetical protein
MWSSRWMSRCRLAEEIAEWAPRNIFLTAQVLFTYSVTTRIYFHWQDSDILSQDVQSSEWPEAVLQLPCLGSLQPSCWLFYRGIHLHTWCSIRCRRHIANHQLEKQLTLPNIEPTGARSESHTWEYTTNYATRTRLTSYNSLLQQIHHHHAGLSATTPAVESTGSSTATTAFRLQNMQFMFPVRPWMRSKSLPLVQQNMTVIKDAVSEDNGKTI